MGADNAEHMPVVIHRAIFGSFERFIARVDARTPPDVAQVVTVVVVPEELHLFHPETGQRMDTKAHMADSV